MTYVFFEQLQFTISINVCFHLVMDAESDLLIPQKMADVFVQQGEGFLALSILIKHSSTFTLSNSFLLFELCRTCEELLKAGYITPSCFPLPRIHTIHQSLLLFMPYLADHLENQWRMCQKVLLPNSYLSAMFRCLWYLQSPSQ